MFIATLNQVGVVLGDFTGFQKSVRLPELVNIHFNKTVELFIDNTLIKQS